MEFRELISRIVSTIRVYEKGFTSVKRNPVDYQIRVKSLSEFIECRINFESFKIDELRKYEELMDGNLFIVSSLDGENGNSFDRATILIGSKPSYMSDNEYDDLVESVSKFIGGNTVTFTSDKNNLGINIY